MAKFSQHHCNVSCTDVVIAAAKRATESADRAEAAAETAAQDAMEAIAPQVDDLVQQSLEDIVATIPVVTTKTQEEFDEAPSGTLKRGIYIIKDAL